MYVKIDVTGMNIETERLQLRAFTEDDLEDLYGYASVEGVGEMAGWPRHKSIDDSKKVLEMFLNDKDALALVHKKDGKVIGSLGFHNSWADKDDHYKDVKFVEIGYALSKEYWGNGLVAEGVKAVLAHLFNMGLDAVFVSHFVDNVQSKRVIEKCGFSYVKQGTYYAKQLDKSFDESRYVVYA